MMMEWAAERVGSGRCPPAVAIRADEVEPDFSVFPLRFPAVGRSL